MNILFNLLHINHQNLNFDFINNRGHTYINDRVLLKKK